MAAAKTQAKISRRFASKDPDAEVPSVAASHRCSATMTAARMRGFRGIPCRTLAVRGEVLTRIYFMRKAAGPGTNPRRRALPDTGRFRERLYLAQCRPCLGVPAFERVAPMGLDGGDDTAPQRDAVHRGARGETLQRDHLTAHSIALVDGGD